MNLNFKASVDFENPEFQSFLFDKKSTNYNVDPVLEDNFSNLEADRRPNTDKPHNDNVLFFVREKYGLYQNNSLRGINKITVVYQQNIDITTVFWLSFKSGAVEDFMKECRSLFKKYNPNIDGSNIEDFIAAKLDPNLDKSLFSIDTEIVIAKTSDKKEFNIDQRLALRGMYENGVPRSHFEFENFKIEGGINTWYHDTESKLIKIEPDELEKNTSPQISQEIQEVPKGKSEEMLTSILDGITSIIIPSQCHEMRREQPKLLTLLGWPEFKITWEPAVITVGCAHITIVYPKLHTRKSNLNLYIHYSLPVNSAQTLWLIVRTCAERAALEGCVMGIIVGNPGVALASFNALFKSCIESEIKNCFDAGILTLIESDGWS